MNIMDIKKNLFQNVINDYEYGRPQYPEELYAAVNRFSGIGPASEILEVGAGTGQATGLFALHGHRLDLLEVSDQQVTFLQGKYGLQDNIKVTKSYFEDYEPDKQYDLIYSATAFHWIKCENGYPKAWRMLREGGTMAVFWNVFFDLYHSGGIFDGLNELRKAYMPNESLGDDLETIKDKRIRQITVGGYFEMPEYIEFHWTDRYDAKRFTAWANTYSRVLVLGDKQRMEYLNAVEHYILEQGGVVDVPQTVSLYMVKKNARNGRSV